MATPATVSGVLTLRQALRRARRLGAHVENVHATGEVRVIHGDHRLVINNRRKDATRELMALVAELEAAHPSLDDAVRQYQERPMEARIDPDAQPIQPVMTFAQRLRNHMRTNLPPDAFGWRTWDSKIVADDLATSTTNVAASLNHSERQGMVELRRDEKSRRILAVRFMDERPAGEVDAPPPARATRTLAEIREASRAIHVADEARAAHPPVNLEALGKANGAEPTPIGVLPTPHLAQYADALKTSRTNDLLKVEPDPVKLEAILHEAARLYWWVRAGKT